MLVSIYKTVFCRNVKQPGGLFHNPFRSGAFYRPITSCLVLLSSAALFVTPVNAASILAYKYVSDIRQGLPDTEFIQQLIDETGEGEVCQIPEGDYSVDGLSVTRPVELNGGGGVTLRYFDWNAPEVMGRSIEQSYIFAVWSDGVVIDGFNFVNTDLPASTGIIHLIGDNLEIRNNTFMIGQECAGIISKAAASQCVVDGNVFSANSGIRSFPMIQFNENSYAANIKNNVLEGDVPDMLSNDFLTNFMSVESANAVVADNKFLYTGPWNEEDFGGYEDAETQITQDAFAEMTKSRISEINPWTRSSGDKGNPETSGGFNTAALGVSAVIQAGLVLAYFILRGKGRTRRKI